MRGDNDYRIDTDDDPASLKDSESIYYQLRVFVALTRAA